MIAIIIVVVIVVVCLCFLLRQSFIVAIYCLQPCLTFVNFFFLFFFFLFFLLLLLLLLMFHVPLGFLNYILDYQPIVRFLSAIIDQNDLSELFQLPGLSTDVPSTVERRFKSSNSTAVLSVSQSCERTSFSPKA